MTPQFDFICSAGRFTFKNVPLDETDNMADQIIAQYIYYKES